MENPESNPDQKVQNLDLEPMPFERSTEKEEVKDDEDSHQRSTHYSKGRGVSTKKKAL